MLIRFIDVNFYYVYQGCILGKHLEEKHDKGKTWTDTYVMELIHSDIIVPFSHPLFNRVECILTFIDDHSKYTYVFFL